MIKYKYKTVNISMEFIYSKYSLLPTENEECIVTGIEAQKVHMPTYLLNFTTAE